MSKLILITGKVGMLNENAAIAAGYDDLAEYTEKVRSKWNAVCGSNTVDVYVLGSLFGELTLAQAEAAESILRKLPGRKYLITDKPDAGEALLPAWYSITDGAELTIEGQQVFLTESSDWEPNEGELIVHANALETDTATHVCGAWERWGEMFGLVNAHYLVGYAKNIGAGFIEG